MSNMCKEIEEKLEKNKSIIRQIRKTCFARKEQNLKIMFFSGKA